MSFRQLNVLIIFVDAEKRSFSFRFFCIILWLFFCVTKTAKLRQVACLGSQAGKTLERHKLNGKRLRWKIQLQPHFGITDTALALYTHSSPKYFFLIFSLNFNLSSESDYEDLLSFGEDSPLTSTVLGASIWKLEWFGEGVPQRLIYVLSWASGFRRYVVVFSCGPFGDWKTFHWDKSTVLGFGPWKIWRCIVGTVKTFH